MLWIAQTRPICLSSRREFIPLKALRLWIINSPLASLTIQAVPAKLFPLDQAMPTLHLSFLEGGERQRLPIEFMLRLPSWLLAPDCCTSNQCLQTSWILFTVASTWKTFPSNENTFLFFHRTHRTQGNTREITSGTSFLTEAEYKGIANAVAETCFLRNLLLELHCPLGMATLVFCDNISSVYLSTNPMKHQHTKHIEIDLHFFREKVALGQVKFFHVSSTLQYVEIFSKGLPTLLLTDFRSSLTVRCANDLTAGGWNNMSIIQISFSLITYSSV